MNKSKFWRRFTGPVILVAIMWIVLLLFGDKAHAYGIVPRDLASIRGVIFAPFIHGDINHLLANTLPILIFSIILSFFYKKIWLLVWLLVSVTGGLLVWLMARSNTNHIGASITIFRNNFV